MRKKQETLSKNDFTRKHKKESAEAMERLSQAALSGLKHVCETLGMPPMDPDTQIADLINSVDSLLDTLLEEKDRAQQKTAIEGIPRREPHKVEKSHRASELNAALVHYETPKQRVANRLHGRISEGASGTESSWHACTTRRPLARTPTRPQPPLLSHQPTNPPNSQPRRRQRLRRRARRTSSRSTT